MKNKEERIKISRATDVGKASSEARRFCQVVGFDTTAQYMISTAVSELARNIYLYAMKGEITIRALEKKTKKGIEVVAEDEGSGIRDIGEAMKDHLSTSEGLGLGLPGAKRLMDEFSIDTERTRGTKITVRKWV